MTKFDFINELENAQVAAYKAKAIAAAFAVEYIDSTDYKTTAAVIQGNPDQFVYLFAAMREALSEACRKLGQLTDAKVEG